MIYYLNTFISYSFLGYLIESFMKYFVFKNINNGFLFGPWIPVYGIGTCIIIFIMRIVFNRIKSNRFIKIVLLFLISMITLTLLEFIGGHFIHLITGKVFWDYSNLKYNIGPYIALEISFVWGVMSLVVTYLIKPAMDKLIIKIPNYITYILLIIIIVDFIISLILN